MQLKLAIYNGILRSPLLPNRFRRQYLNAIGAKVSGRVSPNVWISSPELTIGAQSTINVGCVIDCRSGVHIGDRVGVGIGVTFTTSDHETSNPSVRAGVGKLFPIRVEDGAFIGTNATILRGVTIGAGAVIAAGAVVKDDVPPHELWAGVPAVKKRDLPR